MPDFRYQDGEFYCEAVPLRRIAEAVGTPCYIYSHATLVRDFRSFDSAFSEVPHLVAYAIKANSNLALLRLLANEGAGGDIVSGGELYRALQAGIEPQRIVFAGVGKSDDEVRYALRSNILMFKVESLARHRSPSPLPQRWGRARDHLSGRNAAAAAGPRAGHFTAGQGP